MQNPEMIFSLYSGKASNQCKLLEAFDQSKILISDDQLNELVHKLTLYQSPDVRTSCVHVLLEAMAAHFAIWQGWCCMQAKSLCQQGLEVQQSGDKTTSPCLHNAA